MVKQSYNSCLLQRLVIVFSTFSFHAYSCTEIPFDQRFNDADVVFAAKVRLAANQDADSIGKDAPFYEYDYKTLYIWKGEPGTSGHLRLTNDCRDDEIGGCSSKTSEGDTLLMFSSWTGYGLETEYCNAGGFEVAFLDRLELAEPEISYAPALEQVTTELLRDSLGSKSWFIVLNAAHALKQLGRGDEVLQYISQHQWPCDFSEYQFNNLISMFYALGKDASFLIPEFDHFWYCGDESVRVQWMKALVLMASGDELKTVIVRALDDENYWVRRFAVEATVALDAIALLEVRGQLLAMLHSNNPDERLRGAQGVGYFGDLNTDEIIAVCTFSLKGLQEFFISQASDACSEAVSGNKDSARQSVIGTQVLESGGQWSR